uniref:Uncharacterized protein n=1 Tax=Sphaerodactylus townsendi TaxID=933632 RepID=A0ACB8F728_9SAUR
MRLPPMNDMESYFSTSLWVPDTLQANPGCTSSGSNKSSGSEEWECNILFFDHLIPCIKQASKPVPVSAALEPCTCHIRLGFCLPFITTYVNNWAERISADTALN